MSWSAGAIVGKLDLDTGGFTHGFLQAEGLMHLFPNAVTEFLANPLLGFADIAKEAFGFLRETLMQSVENAAEMKHMATDIGLSATEFSRFAFAAGMTKAPVEELAASFKFLGKNVFDAISQGPGSDAARVFRRYGVEFQDTSGHARELGEVMKDVADAIQMIPPGAERTGAAMDLISARSTGMIAMLQRGRKGIDEWGEQSDKSGNTVSESAARASEAFEELEHRIQATFGGIKERIAGPLRDALLPILGQVPEMLDRISSWTGAHMPNIQAAIETIQFTVSHVIDGLKIMLGWLGDIADKAAKLWYGDEEFRRGGDQRSEGARTSLGAAYERKADREEHIHIHMPPIEKGASSAQIAQIYQEALKKARGADANARTAEQTKSQIQEGLSG